MSLSGFSQGAGSPIPNAQQINRDRDNWKSLTRSEALRACRTRPVAVLHRDQGPESAAWLTPANRFFASGGPYLYSSLRYFAFQGAGPDFGMGTLAKLSAAKPPEADELEPLEAMDMSGAALSLASPGIKKPPLPSIPDLPGLPDLGLPTLPSLPEGLAMPAFPILPELEEKPEPVPIEFRLLDGLGNPLPPTFFRVSLPDGGERTGKSDDDGFIRIPDNTQRGESKLELLDHEPEPEAVAAAAVAGAGIAGATGRPGKEKHPIEIRLVDADGAPMPDKGFRINLSDGNVREDKSDKDGFIRIADNTSEGELELVLTDFETKEDA